MKYVLVAFLALLALVGCSRSHNETSSLMHVEGEFPRARTEAFQAYTQPACDSTQLERCAYTKDLFNILVSANPQVFQGQYAPEKFQVTVEKTNMVNAFAYPNFGLVYIMAGIFKIYDTDAAAFQVLAHETSHILMRHDQFFSGADHPKLANDGMWRYRKAEYSENSRRLASTRAELVQQRDQLRHQRNSVVGYLGGRIEAALANAPDVLRDRIIGYQATSSEKVAELESTKAQLEQLRSTTSDPAAVIPVSMKIESLEFEISQLDEEIHFLNEKLDLADHSLNAEIASALDEGLGGFIGQVWRAIKRKIDTTDEAIRLIDQEQAEGYDNLMNYASLLLGYQYDLYNWVEAEADQVGLELGLNAGVNPDSAAGIYYGFIQDSELKQKCHDLVARAKNGENVSPPYRGQRTHPASCWRVYNTAITELKIHSSHYSTLLPNAKTDDFFPGRLATLK